MKNHCFNFTCVKAIRINFALSFIILLIASLHSTFLKLPFDNTEVISRFEFVQNFNCQKLITGSIVTNGICRMIIFLHLFYLEEIFDDQYAIHSSIRTEKRFFNLTICEYLTSAKLCYLL